MHVIHYCALASLSFYLITFSSYASQVTVTDDAGTSLEGARVVFVDPVKAINVSAATDMNGQVTLTMANSASVVVYCTHPKLRAFRKASHAPTAPLKIILQSQPNTGSTVFQNGTGYVPGLTGRLNPIRDTLNRLYIFASNMAIEGGLQQPVPFQLGRRLQIEDTAGNIFGVQIMDIIGNTSLVEFEKLQAPTLGAAPKIDPERKQRIESDARPAVVAQKNEAATPSGTSYIEVDAAQADVEALKGKIVSIHGLIDKIEKDGISANTFFVTLNSGFKCRVSRDPFIRDRRQQSSGSQRGLAVRASGLNDVTIEYQGKQILMQGTEVIVRGTLKKEMNKVLLDRAGIRGCSESSVRSALDIHCGGPCHRSSYYYGGCNVCGGSGGG